MIISFAKSKASQVPILLSFFNDVYRFGVQISIILDYVAIISNIFDIDLGIEFCIDVDRFGIQNDSQNPPCGHYFRTKS